MFFIAIVITLITGLVSYQGFKNPALIERYSFNPYKVKEQKEYYRVFTHVFFHANTTHLFFNLLSFYFVGRYLEYVLVDFYGTYNGSIHFLLVYFGGAVIGTLNSYAKHANNPNYQSIGASGAVSASIFGFIIWMPDVEFLLFFFIPMKAYVFGLLFLAYEYFSIRRQNSRIAHDVHFISAIYGVVYVLIINFDKGKEFIDLILR